MCWRSSPSASSLPTPTGAVTSGMGVMTAETRREWSASNRMSRLVTMPSRVPSVIGDRHAGDAVPAAQRLHVGDAWRPGRRSPGLVIIPASDRFTMSACCACSSTDRLRCSTPTPPCRAMATAIRASVTVSMAEEISGTRSRIRRLSRAVVSASAGSIAE